MSRYGKSKGQTSIEFMVMIIMVMIVFAVFYTQMASEQFSAQRQQQTLYMDAVAQKVAFELKMGLAQGPGYHRNFTLPQQMLGNSYTVNVTDGLVVLGWQNTTAVTNVPVKTINGNITPGENRIRNNGGELYVD